MVSRQGSVLGYDVVAERGVMVPARDGARLATDIYFPAREGARAGGRWPVLLERTPYDKRGLLVVRAAKFFAAHGYAVALQDVRGRFDSEGEWYPFAREAEDGYDTVQWLGEQAWSTGKVGTMGHSYSGSDQHALATLRPPSLAAMAVTEGMVDYHRSAMRQGGALELRFLVYAFKMAMDAPGALGDPELRRAAREEWERVSSWLLRGPLRESASALSRFPSIERWALDIQREGDYGEYWRQRGYSFEAHASEHADVPVLLVGGWYDSYARSTTEAFKLLGAVNSSSVRMVMGPWIHGIAQLAESWAGNTEFGPDAPLDYDGLRLRFFDATLKGLQTGLLEEPPVRFFLMGGGSARRTPEDRLDHGGYWVDSPTWPPPGAAERTLYLHGGGRLDSVMPGEGEQPSTSYDFDPAAPVPTIGGNISAADEVMLGGGFDQRGQKGFMGCIDELPLNARADVLSFLSDPLEDAMAIVGPVEVVLWASTSALDTDFTAKLIDLYPPSGDYPAGYALNLSDSIIRGRYREGRDQAVAMEPGEVYELRIVLYPIANRFAAGHRIRLDVSSSNFPRFDVNPNTGEPVGESRCGTIARNTVHHSRELRSHLLVQVVPELTGEFQAAGAGRIRALPGPSRSG